MRIDQVRATAFGPLIRETLDLAPGMTVVHGPNEAGKSAWFAATYAALAGRRKGRGRGTAAQTEFRKQHQPWTGSRWAVGATLSLASGAVLSLEHNLTKGDTTVAGSGLSGVGSVEALERAIGRELRTEGGFDGARLLGLNREALRAIAFVAQADVLRVVEDAGQLQSLLERAAGNVQVDMTADGALQALRDLRSERVGAENVGSRPLRAARQRLESARGAVDSARDLQNDWVSTLINAQRAERELSRAEAELAQSERALAWTRLRADQERLGAAESLAAALQEMGDPVEVPDEALQDRVRTALARYEDRATPDVEPTAVDDTADSADELRRTLADLPEMPTGDVEPRPSIIEAHRNAIAAHAALRSHDESGDPAASTIDRADPSAPPADPERLRTLAGILDEKVPAASDPALAAELAAVTARHAEAHREYLAAMDAHQVLVEDVEAERASYRESLAAFTRDQAAYDDAVSAWQVEADRRRAEATAAAEASSRVVARGTAIAGTGAALLALAIVLTVVGLVPIGIGVAALGLAGTVGGVVVRTRGGSQASSAPAAADTPRPVAPTAPTPPDRTAPEAPVAPVVPPRIAELEARLRLLAEQSDAATVRRQSAIDEITDLGIEVDPDALRATARGIEDAVAASARAQARAARRTALAEALRSATGVLNEALDDAGQPGGSPDAEADPVSAVEHAASRYTAYTTSCRERAQQAAQASRREDLASRLAARVAADVRSAEEAAKVATLEAAVVELHREVRELEGQAVPHGEAAADLAGWLEQAQRDAASLASRRSLEARLDQALEGRDLDEWRATVAAAIAEAGEDPAVDVTEGDVATRRSEADRLRTVVGNLEGRTQPIAESSSGLANAIEQEAEAERALAHVESLKCCLDLASSELQAAKEAANRSVAPLLERLIQPRVARVTDGRYTDVRLDPETLGMTATDAAGRRSDALLLSHGTTEQLYILLRLALAELLVRDDEPTPIVLDDVTVQSDAGRTIGILELLHEVSRDRQVVLFTQEDEVVAWAEANLTGSEDRIQALPLRG